MKMAVKTFTEQATEQAVELDEAKRTREASTASDIGEVPVKKAAPRPVPVRPSEPRTVTPVSESEAAAERRRAAGKDFPGEPPPPPQVRPSEVAAAKAAKAAATQAARAGDGT